MFSIPIATRPHWNYFLALEKDLETVSRYVEFCHDNLNTYSIELAHLLLSAASEVDTVAKCVCSLLVPHQKSDNINDYRGIVKASEENEIYGFTKKKGKLPVADEKHRHRLSDLKVYIPRYGLEFVPWRSWIKDKNPGWWHSYNHVKHERNRYFREASLENALHALAALLTINYLYCRLEITKTRPEFRYQYRGKSVTRYMLPASTFLRFGREFYDDPLADLAKCMSATD